MTYNDFSLNPQVRVLVQPDLHSCFGLKEFEDQELYIDKIKTMSKNKLVGKRENLAFCAYDRSDHEPL